MGVKSLGFVFVFFFFNMFQTLAEILKEIEQELLSPKWCMITYLSFQKGLSIISQPQMIPKLGRNGSAAHL